MHIDGKLLVIIDCVVESGLTRRSIRKLSWARPGFRRWPVALVTCVVFIFWLSCLGLLAVPTLSRVVWLQLLGQSLHAQ